MRKKSYGVSRDLTFDYNQIIQKEFNKKKSIEDSDNLIFEKNNQGK